MLTDGSGVGISPHPAVTTALRFAREPHDGERYSTRITTWAGYERRLEPSNATPISKHSQALVGLANRETLACDHYQCEDQLRIWPGRVLHKAWLILPLRQPYLLRVAIVSAAEAGVKPVVWYRGRVDDGMDRREAYTTPYSSSLCVGCSQPLHTRLYSQTSPVSSQFMESRTD